ncbi:MAG: hypothetical protein VB035_00765 [Candidatus Fimivivens sp.]|nr:hypothetical protein [Candidatus Fimivivens sp.]
MRIPHAAQARAALGALYDDHLTNTREVDGGNVMDTVTIAQCVPCHLSVSRSKLAQSDTTAATAFDYTVYLPVDSDIQTGDVLTVCHKEQTFKGVAGLPVRGSLSLAVPVTGVVIA